LLAQRAYAYGELGEKWNEAAVDLNDAVEISPYVSPYDVLLWYRLALVHLKRNSSEEYARTCTRMLERQIQGYFRPNDLVWTCVLAKGSVTDTAVLVQIAERAVAGNPRNPDNLNILGAALYRAGRYEEAIRRLKDASKALADQQSQEEERARESQSPQTQFAASSFQHNPALDLVFLAMAHQALADKHRLESEESQARHSLASARAALERAREQRKAGEAKTGDIRVPVAWDKKLELEILFAEAEQIVKLDAD
jgi:tetratricopeptide (TPR) repeat protein